MLGGKIGNYKNCSFQTYGEGEATLDKSSQLLEKLELKKQLRKLR